MKIYRRVNKKAMENLLNTVKKARVAVGWTGDLAQIAYIQEYGANLKGNQPYMVDNDGYMTFLRKNSRLGKLAMKAGQHLGTGNVKVRRKNVPNPKSKIAGLGVTKPTRLPARFLLLHTQEDNQNKWKEFAGELGKKVAQGKAHWKGAMETLGDRIKTDIQAEISAGQPPRNTTLTAMRKGFNHPLESQKNQLRREIRVISEVE
ncbi:MAG: hypothetical protein IKB61_02620 [Elusimicrobiaceae bacterium]|nr:hypothetical protein [Elusimicrobiaceae bacterium]MBR4355361.1 hypothetical protein [Elusimicrobiaceae bacterium]